MAQAVREDRGLPIAAVEQATGIARATLRIWERRYGFPQPGRDLRDERSYGSDEVEKLRLIAALLARGHRPGQLVRLTPAQLLVLAGTVPAIPVPAQADPLMALLQRDDAAGLQAQLLAEVQALGLEGFVLHRLPGLNEHIGTAWAAGSLQVYQEHLYSEMVQDLLRQAIGALPAPARGERPCVLLATFSDEAHALGLLMVEVLLRLATSRAISLGPRVPVPQIVAAALAFDADIVGVSFSAGLSPAHVLRGLEQLRAELPARVALWAGGTCPVTGRRRLAGVQVLREIAQVPPALAAWRARQAMI